MTLEVGSAITGYTGGSLGDGNWYVLGAEGGHLLITTASNVGSTITLSGQTGYTDGITTMNSAVSSYVNTSYADSVRAVNIDDINRVTGYNPLAKGDGTGYPHDSGKVSEYGNIVTYSKTSGYIYYQGEKQPTTSTSSSYTSFVYYDGTSWVSLNNGESITLTSTSYYYTPDSLKIVGGGTVNGISKSSNAYKLLFKTSMGSSDADYWLASQKISTEDGYVNFDLNNVSDGYASTWVMYRSNGGTNSGTHGVRPVVTLKDDVIVSGNGAIDSYVGYYADFEGDGIVDGIIFADLKNAVSSQWNDSDGAYSYNAVTNLKDYYISKSSYTSDFGTQPVLTPVSGTSGNERFYVMKLDDYASSTYTWDSEYALGTMYDGEDVGDGYDNTYDAIACETFSEGDFFYEYEQGIEDWFVPSRGEWSAFAQNLGITSSNYTTYRFK